MVPGKKYTPEDYLTLAWNHKWLIVFCTLIVAAGTFVWAWNLPDRYRAQTLIQVVPQRVPTSFVTPTVTTGIGPRLQMMSQMILSRTQLERLVQELDLYPVERRTLIMEDVILQMRRDIGVNVAGSRGREPAASFTVSFASENPRTALVVTQRLASLFVSANLENREMLADTTTQFIDTQLDEARRRLIEHEKRLEDYRRQYAGQLPDQVDTNLQMMQGAQARRQSLADEVSRDRDRLAALNQAIAEATERAASGATGTGETADGSTLPVAQQLERARAQVRGLELRLKPEHPDLRQAKRIVAELEAKAEAEALQQPLSPSSPGASGPVSAASAAANRLDQMRTEAERLQARLEKLALEQQSVEDALATYRARLDAIPTRQSELVELMRDYSTLQNTYTSLLGKSEQSKLAVNLERRQVGEQFRIVDNAQLPQRPTSPNRPRLYVMGLLGGLALGLALTALLEYRDTTLKTDSDILVSLSLPVLAVIPAMITEEERTRARRRVVLTGLAGSVAGVAVAAVLVWRLGLLDGWVR